MNRLFLFAGKTFAIFALLFFFVTVGQVVIYGYAAKSVAAAIAGSGGVAIASYTSLKRDKES